MMQVRSPRSTAEARSGGGSSSTPSCRNLGVFFDGTREELGKPCGAGRWQLSGTCETNVAALWRLAGEVDQAQQLSHYEPGVGSSGSPDDDGNLGTGTKQHMLNAYKWLGEKYEPCGNKVFLFGYSRGALSARMLQGMIHRVGLAKPGRWHQAAQMHFSAFRPSSDVAAFKGSDMVWQDVKIEYVGLFEAVLRTLLHPFIHSDLANFHMRLTSSVLRLSNAISIDEHREIFEAAELYADPATNATQVWFLGEHSDVGGGGHQKTGVKQIARGWTADQAEDAGFFLPAGWRGRSEMAVNYLGGTMPGLWSRGTWQGLHLELVLGLGLVRNPMKCRDSPGHPLRGQQVLFHRSVADRMQGNPGWAPLPFCCGGSAAELQGSVRYVTSEHYEARRAGASGGAPWLKLTFGWLRGVRPGPFYDDEWGWYPEHYVKATGWSDEVPLPAGGVGPYDGCCSVVSAHPFKGGTAEFYWGCEWWRPCPRFRQDFRRTALVLPNISVAANKVIVELHEDDTLQDDFVGRVEIQLSGSTIGQMQPYRLTSGAKIDIRVESVPDDAAAKALLPGSGKAQCRWLQYQTGMSMESLCNPTSTLTGGLHLASAKTCDDWIESVKTGAL